MEGWHTFGLWWKPDEYVFYVDGKETWRTKAGGVCQVPEYIKLSDEIGNWAGDIKKAKLPDAFLVDYVRVYDWWRRSERLVLPRSLFASPRILMSNPLTPEIVCRECKAPIWRNRQLLSPVRYSDSRTGWLVEQNQIGVVGEPMGSV